MDRAALEARFAGALLDDAEMKSEASWAELPDPLPRFSEDEDEDEASASPTEAHA
jgi:hypothetical protein